MIAAPAPLTLGVLLAGVTARYVFHAPLVWTDELASILFLWLAMLGAVVAFQRGEHMRMTALVGKVAPPWRAFLDILAVVAALAFLLIVVEPAFEFDTQLGRSYFLRDRSLIYNRVEVGFRTDKALG